MSRMRSPRAVSSTARVNGIAVGAGLSLLGTTAAADARIALAVAARWSIRSESDGMLQWTTRPHSHS